VTVYDLFREILDRRQVVHSELIGRGALAASDAAYRRAGKKSIW